jgi:hypothetical protein
MTVIFTGMSCLREVSGSTGDTRHSRCISSIEHYQKGDSMGKKIKRTNRHHRLSRSRSRGIPINGDVSGIPNVQIVDYKKHQAFHHMFQDTHPIEIARELNANWVDPTYVMIAITREDARKVLKHLSQLT